MKCRNTGSIELGTVKRESVHIFLFIVRYFFVVCIGSSKSVVFIISLSAIFSTIDDILIFQEGFYGKFQNFFNSSICAVVAPSYTSICHNFCFTKLLTLSLISFFSEVLLSCLLGLQYSVVTFYLKSRSNDLSLEFI